MTLTDDNYYSIEVDTYYCSASQYREFMGCPILHGCEARAMARLRGEYTQETTTAMLIGSIFDALWEGLDAAGLAERFPECVSTRGTTKGELKSEYKKAIRMYERTVKDRTFATYMSGEHQTIMTGVIADLPFKIKMDSYHPGKAIVDAKTTINTHPDYREYIKDSGERLPFYLAWGYQNQLAIYREIVRQNTGDTLNCYICAVDKKEHPRPEVIQLDNKTLDDALEEVKRNAHKILALKNGEIEPINCNSDGCDYCRDNYECKVISQSEFEVSDE